MQQMKAISNNIFKICFIVFKFFNYLSAFRVFFLRSVKDLVPKYLTELNCINDDLSKELVSRFKTLNYMLERM